MNALRVRIAIAAMNAIISKIPVDTYQADRFDELDTHAMEVALGALAYADALIEQLEKGDKNEPS